MSCDEVKYQPIFFSEDKALEFYQYYSLGINMGVAAVFTNVRNNTFIFAPIDGNQGLYRVALRITNNLTKKT